MQPSNSSVLRSVHAVPQLAELHTERAASPPSVPVTAIWAVIVLLALGIGGYFVARAQAINASAHAELEILRMTAAHNAEMFAFRERLQKVDAQIAAARASIAASALMPTSPTIKSGTRTPVGTRTSSVRNTGHRPSTVLHDPHDALEGLDSTDFDPLGGLDARAPAPRRKRPRLE